jgi:tetratricopeptide (TPR) repeat protein
LVAVALLALTVIVLLPRLVSDAPPGSPVADSVPGQEPASGDTAAARRAAEQALQAYLHQRARLELEKAATWGEPEWSNATGAATAGDRLFGQRRFRMAAESYITALQGLESLEAARGARLTAALEAARRALANNDAPLALAQFERALAIEPDNAQAQSGLQRARVRDELLALLAAGRQAESDADLPVAQAAYEKAVRLDPAWQPTATALQRVTQQRLEQQFQAAMSRAVAALEAGRFTQAATALGEATALKPGAAVVRDTRQRLAQARQQARLTALQHQAEARVRAEDWQAAVELYRKALAVDARAGFAQTGLEQSQDRARLHKQLDHYLDDPARVYSAEPLANAEQLLAAAGQAPPGEPRLAEKLTALQRLVNGARTPMTVTLHSDGMTDVVIYHVGRLGAFERRQLELRPGSYTAVGSCAGYRDVRRTIEVMPGSGPLSVDIRCEEPV